MAGAPGRVSVCLSRRAVPSGRSEKVPPEPDSARVGAVSHRLEMPISRPARSRAGIRILGGLVAGAGRKVHPGPVFDQEHPLKIPSHRAEEKNTRLSSLDNFGCRYRKQGCTNQSL